MPVFGSVYTNRNSELLYPLSTMPIPLFWTSEYSQIHDNEHQILKIQEVFVPLSNPMNGVLRSPGRATFGGFWSLKKLDQIHIRKALDKLYDLRPTTREFHLVLPPTYFQKEIFDPQRVFFHGVSFSRIIDINFHIDLHSNYITSKGNRKKMRQFREQGGVVVQSDSSDWEACYQLLVNNRARRGVKLSMSWDIFKKSLEQLPLQIKLWKAVVKNMIVGCAVTVRISQDSLYVLFWGDNEYGRSLSAVASICDSLLVLAKSENVRYLDLGISSVEGILDPGLARFKSNLGAIQGQKITYKISFM